MSKQLFKEKPSVLRSVCSCCKLEVGRSGTMTDWIFKENRCKCSATNLTHSLVVVGSNKASVAPGTLGESRDSKSTQPPHINLGPNYEVLSVLGQGGIGTVYKVRETHLDKIFAAKVLSTELMTDPLALRRFEQEAEAASSLSTRSTKASSLQPQQWAVIACRQTRYFQFNITKWLSKFIMS